MVTRWIGDVESGTIQDLFCERCRDYSISELGKQGTSNGTCVHTQLLKQQFRLISTLIIDSAGMFQDSFVMWIKRQTDLKSSCVRLQTKGQTERFFVIIPAFQALEGEINQASICSVFRGQWAVTVKCNSAGCSKGKNKALFRLEQLVDLCHHLQHLFNSEFKEELVQLLPSSKLTIKEQQGSCSLFHTFYIFTAVASFQKFCFNFLSLQTLRPKQMMKLSAMKMAMKTRVIENPGIRLECNGVSFLLNGFPTQVVHKSRFLTFPRKLLFIGADEECFKWTC